MLAAGEDAAKQNRRVDRRNFRIPEPLARVDIGPVVEETAMVRQFLPQKAKRVSARARASAWEM